MIKIIGGTYREINLDLGSYNILGSGLRSAHFILENYKQNVEYFTYGNDVIEELLEQYKNTYNNFIFNCYSTQELITFKYNFALDNPCIYPLIDTISKNKTLKVNGGNFICFGMLEGDFEIKGDKVVYDPQTSINPIRFNTKNKAKELIYVVNYIEARTLSNSSDLNKISEFFFVIEKVKALIIKNGPHGAKIFTDTNTSFNIPVFKTDNVYKIGSGDIFTSAFAFYWFNNEAFTLEQCARHASMCTALYCNYESLKINHLNFHDFEFNEYKVSDLNQKQIYIASPIFSLSDVILVDKVRSVLLDIGVKVFSPYHDIGYGCENTIARADLKAIDESDIIFSIIDGLDSGTLVELGYAMAKGKKIIGYQRTVEKDSLLMLSPSQISYYSDITTAIYHTIWNL
jgi:hypothetical protein